MDNPVEHWEPIDIDSVFHKLSIFTYVHDVYMTQIRVLETRWDKTKNQVIIERLPDVDGTTHPDLIVDMAHAVFEKLDVEYDDFPEYNTTIYRLVNKKKRSKAQKRVLERSLDDELQDAQYRCYR